MPPYDYPAGNSVSASVPQALQEPVLPVPKEVYYDLEVSHYLGPVVPETSNAPTFDLATDTIVLTYPGEDATQKLRFRLRNRSLSRCLYSTYQKQAYEVIGSLRATQPGQAWFLTAFQAVQTYYQSFHWKKRVEVDLLSNLKVATLNWISNPDYWQDIEKKVHDPRSLRWNAIRCRYCVEPVCTGVDRRALATLFERFGCETQSMQMKHYLRRQLEMRYWQSDEAAQKAHDKHGFSLYGIYDASEMETGKVATPFGGCFLQRADGRVHIRLMAILRDARRQQLGTYFLSNLVDRFQRRGYSAFPATGAFGHWNDFLKKVFPKARSTDKPPSARDETPMQEVHFP